MPRSQDVATAAEIRREALRRKSAPDLKGERPSQKDAAAARLQSAQRRRAERVGTPSYIRRLGGGESGKSTPDGSLTPNGGSSMLKPPLEVGRCAAPRQLRPPPVHVGASTASLASTAVEEPPPVTPSPPAAVASAPPSLISAPFSWVTNAWQSQPSQAPQVYDGDKRIASVSSDTHSHAPDVPPIFSTSRSASPYGHGEEPLTTPTFIEGVKDFFLFNRYARPLQLLQKV